METRRTNNMVLLIGLAASVIVHIMVLFPVFVSVLSTPDDHVLLLRASFEEEAYRPRDEPEREVHLGLQESPHFSPNIVGYDEYQKHVAPVADVEQPDLSIQDPGAPAAQAQPSEVVQPPAETPTPAEPEATEQFDLDESSDATGSGQAPEAPLPSEQIEQPPTAEDVQAIVDQITDAFKRLFPRSPAQDPLKNPDDIPADELAAESNAEQPTAPVEPQPAAPAEASNTKPETTPSQPTTEPKPSERPPADLDSDPFSLEMPLENMKTGKPIAGKGIEIKPVKPHQELFQRMTSAPGNPVVEIQFGKDHKPRRCFIRRSSGDTRFDEALKNSLYRWRAIGEEIDKLEGDETVNITLEIGLVERRR